MKTSRVIQFVIAAVLFSAGCVALLAHAFIGFTTVCFCLPPVVLMRRSEAARPIPHRDGVLDWVFGVSLIIFFVVVMTLIFLGKMQVPFSAAERVIRHPAFVIPLWVLIMLGLVWRWRKERRLTDA